MTEKTTPAPRPNRAQILHELNTNGYVVLTNVIQQDLITRLLKSGRKLTDLARAGQWPYLRTCPKQFPPWESSPENGVWGVQHLLHPDLVKHGLLSKEEAAVFVELYFSDVIIPVVKDIFDLDCRDREDDGDDRLIMELFNMLVAPPKDFALRWHRDNISFSLSRNQEAEALGSVWSKSDPGSDVMTFTRKSSDHLHTQYNIPLLPDTSFHIVPGSHLRPRTEIEISLLASNKYTDDLPGWIKVSLKAGDIVFYDNNLIHRGVYSASTERYTLHGSVGNVCGGQARSRNVLQHGIGAFVGDCKFGELMMALQSVPDAGVATRAEIMRRNLIRLGEESSVNVGYAHDD